MADRMLAGSLKSAATTLVTLSSLSRAWAEGESGLREVATMEATPSLVARALMTARPCLPVALKTR